MTTSTITWTRPSDQLPGDETNVLVGLLIDGLRTSCEGFHLDGHWYDVCAVPLDDAHVIGWADMPECPL